jgi:3-hydroxyacyl-[acyl-carrier-protein] dehydratase
MAPSLLFDLSDHLDGPPALDAGAIEAINPHRGQMRLLDGIAWHNEPWKSALAYHDVPDDAFWCAGHIPGRPIFPGVLMIEAAAQLASILLIEQVRAAGLEPPKFVGFAGVDDVKFRGQVTPGDRLYILGKEIKFKPRRCICATQAIVNGTLVYEGTITGMPI